MYTVNTMVGLHIKNSGFSQKEAAAILGISESYLSDVIRGNRRVSPELAEMICDKIVKEYKDSARSDFILHGALADGWDVTKININALVCNNLNEEHTHDN